MPRSRPLEVVGTFQFGFYEFDYAVRAAVAADGRRRCSSGRRARPHSAEAREHGSTRRRSASSCRSSLGASYLVQDWTELNKPLYSALWLEKVAISLTIGLIVMVAALNIVASLVLLVMEKSRDIAILRTMGASARGRSGASSCMQGLTIGLVGTVAGTVLGLVVVLRRSIATS